MERHLIVISMNEKWQFTFVYIRINRIGFYFYQISEGRERKQKTKQKYRDVKALDLITAFQMLEPKRKFENIQTSIN